FSRLFSKVLANLYQGRKALLNASIEYLQAQGAAPEGSKAHARKTQNKKTPDVASTTQGDLGSQPQSGKIAPSNASTVSINPIGNKVSNSMVRDGLLHTN